MGRYRRPATVYRLTWDPPSPLYGLEVGLVVDSVEASLTVQECEDAITRGDLTPAESRRVADVVASCLAGWNLDGRDGRPVPETGPGLLSQDSVLVGGVIRQWVELVRSQPAATEEPPTAAAAGEEGQQDEELGEDDLVESLPVQPLRPVADPDVAGSPVSEPMAS